MKWEKDGYWISDNINDIDINSAHQFLTGAYWCKGVPREIVERAFNRSICFGVFSKKSMVGFGRVVTDYTTFGYLADVYILEPHRGKGLAEWLVKTILAHPELQGFRRWLLATKDAHPLYVKLGFGPLKKPEMFMEINEPEIYSINV
jgi:GNAT superfamily N-acetyltransferase